MLNKIVMKYKDFSSAPYFYISGCAHTTGYVGCLTERLLQLFTVGVLGLFNSYVIQCIQQHEQRPVHCK